jgi:hypothetical protein
MAPAASAAAKLGVRYGRPLHLERRLGDRERGRHGGCRRDGRVHRHSEPYVSARLPTFPAPVLTVASLRATEPFDASGIAYSPNGESILLTDDGTSGVGVARSDGKFLLVFEARDDAPDDDSLEPLPEGQSFAEGEADTYAEDAEDDAQALGDSFGDELSTAEGDSFADMDQDAGSIEQESARRPSLSAVWEEAEVSGISA